MSFEILPSGCGVCGKQRDLSRCGGCKVMPYCGRHHQAGHRQMHKSACNSIKKSLTVMQKEEDELRNSPGDFMTPADPFTNAVGNFWGLLGTRDYMRARFAVGEAMGQIHNVEATEARLAHYMDMLRLCRGDNMGVRSLVPPLMLRLNKDQECYDFIKWWAKDHPSTIWSDPDLPYLDTKDADVFESVDGFDSSFPDLSHIVSVTLLKIKLLLDVMKAQKSASALGPKAPRAIINMVQSFTPQSPLIKGNREILDGDDEYRLRLIKRLKAQIDTLYDRVEEANEHFWPRLINPGDYLHTRPEAYSQGSMEEMALFLQWTHDSWCETPGAMDFINAKTRGDI